MNPSTEYEYDDKYYILVILDTTLHKHGWYLNKNNIDGISYTKFGDETSSVDIQFFYNKINVSVPIKNSPYQYSTSFNNCSDVARYIEDRLIDYNL